MPLITAAITAFYMFRLWFMTFTGAPRDQHVYEHAHESPWLMTGPLVILAVCSVVVAWGARPWVVQDSAMESYLHHGMPHSLHVDTGLALNTVTDQAATTAVGGNFFAKDSWLHTLYDKMGMGPHDTAGVLALLAAGLGVLLSFCVYYWRFMDAAESKERFAGLYRLFARKWHFDELYLAMLVRPAIVVGNWAKWFDKHILDGLIDGTGRGVVGFSKFNGRVDLGVVDGLVNLTAKVIYAVGDWLKGAQTGLIRNYVLFMAVAAVGLFALLSYVIAMAG
jgi:NADH-quinone oxidoreductase subunit L